MNNIAYICPITKVKLDYHAISNKINLDDSGFYYADKSPYVYPVINQTPIFFVFPTKITQSFFVRNSELIQKIKKGGICPDKSPEKGEASVQTTFTEQWTNLGDDELSFTYTHDDLIYLHKSVWLHDDPTITKKINVLNIGCGFGLEAMVLSDIFSNATIYAIDLNLSVVKAGKNLIEKSGSKVIPIAASLFHLPFGEDTFCHIHCQGVAHHTYSTQDAYKAISRHVNPKLGSIFFWVYAWEDSMGMPGFRGALIRMYWFLSHRLLRPILSRAPSSVRAFTIFTMAVPYHFLVSKRRGRLRDKWKFKNTMHGLRDMFTPQYAHQHRWNEVIGWLQESGFEMQVQKKHDFEKKFSQRMLGIGLFGKRVA
ncbi:class I SAM-dependent methyltransferase [Polynucleobacter difficilis]|uniref:class I SAM-dependent methyltransferase n=1 Tax=Polynucleobacter difficilis TaxID=556054 RepID=UPI000D3D4286|nr:class I SAM-dependent methyltransferase [Polynucleobacter difficilis]